MLRTIFFSVLILISWSSYAGRQTGVISKILVHDSGDGTEKLDIRLKDAIDIDMVWCATEKEWTVPLGTEASKAQLSLLLSAYVSGKKVTIHSDSGKVCPDGGRNRIRNVELN